jgi:hypothetical protein
VKEKHALSLQGEIRLAGQATRRVRQGVQRRLVGAAGLAVVATLLTSFLVQLRVDNLVLALAALLALLAAVIGGILFLAALAGTGAAAPLQRWYEARRLQARIGTGSEGEWTAEVRPLLHDPDPDTRKIAAALLRAAHLPGEVSPAAAPGGRGDEVSSADS